MNQTVQLKAERIMNLHVLCSQYMRIENNTEGSLAVIPIIGGTFDGKISGKVISGGADWNTRKARGNHAFAKYVIQAENGEYIAVENEGMIADGQETVISTSPHFTASEDGEYAWLNYGVYAGSLSGGAEPGTVEIVIYQLK